VEPFNKKAAGVTALIVVIGLFIGFSLWDAEDGESQAEELSGFKHEPIQFEDFTFELVGSENSSELHTFQFEIVNTSDASINPSKTFFKIVNGEKQFSSDSSQFESKKVNPGMSTTGEVTFNMKIEDLEEGSPIMEVEHGYVFEEVQEFELKK
jgi:hypothetical protein